MSRPRPLCLLFYCGGSYVSGAELHILGLMMGLQSRGHRVECVVNGWNDGDWILRLRSAGIPYHVNKLGFIYLRKPLWTADTLVHLPGAYFQNARTIKTVSPDYILHVSYRTVLMLRGLLPWRRTVLFCLDAPRSDSKGVILQRYLNNRVYRFIANSQYVKNSLQNLGVENHRIAVAYPGVVDGQFGREPTANPNPDMKAVRLGIVGQIIPTKGHQFLLNALKRVQNSGVDFSLEIYGRGADAYIQELKCLVDTLGLESKVHWHGFVSDRSVIYSDLDIVVVPSVAPEGFGMAAAEPALWNIPTVATAVGGLTEVVQNGITGRLVAPGDVSSLARILIQLISDSSERALMGTRAKATVTRKFTMSRALDAVEDVLYAEGMIGE